MALENLAKIHLQKIIIDQPLAQLRVFFLQELVRFGINIDQVSLQLCFLQQKIG